MFSIFYYLLICHPVPPNLLCDLMIPPLTLQSNLELTLLWGTFALLQMKGKNGVEKHSFDFISEFLVTWGILFDLRQVSIFGWLLTAKCSHSFDFSPLPLRLRRLVWDLNCLKGVQKILFPKKSFLLNDCSCQEYLRICLC